MSGWFFDIEKTKKRYAILQAYYISKCLNAESFSCKMYEDCLKSQKDDTVKQYSGGTSAVMPLYDVEYNGIPIRIMIIGKETGYMKNMKYGTSSNFNENTLNVLNCINWRNKNNHIKGTLYTLQNIFQVDTEYVYSSYVLSDLLRCSFQNASNSAIVSSVRDTQVMRSNCINYLFDEIDILEPTLIITQGEWAIHSKNTFILNLSKRYGKYEPLMFNSNKKYGLYKFSRFMCLTSHHPAILGNWLVNLAPDSLWPMLNYLRQIDYLPIFESKDSIEYEKIATSIIYPMIKDLESNDKLRHEINTKYHQLMLE